MAYKNYNKGYSDSEMDEGSTSKFNAGMLQMKRIHDLQEGINFAWLNPLAYNELAGVWNFEILINNNNTLLIEAWSKLAEKERVDAEKLKDMIDTLLLNYPVFEKKKKMSSPHDTNIDLNKTHWIVIKKVIYKYGLLIKDLLDKHGMNSPNDDDSGL